MNGMKHAAARGVLVVADDFTGANVAAIGFARAGFRAVTVNGWNPTVHVDLSAERFDVVVVNANTRHSPPDQAAQTVFEVVEGMPSAALACNRIDTTLRGNVGATTAAMIAALAEASGRRTVALCVPAYPAAGRHTVDGIQLLHGQRLEETELAADPLNPMTTSDVVTIFEQTSALRVSRIGMGLVTGTMPGLTAALRSAADSADVVVVDAIDEAHLARAARAAAGVSEVNWIAVDPGPGSVALAQALGLAGSRQRRLPVLVVCGSMSALTREQLKRLAATHRTRTVEVSFDDSTGRADVVAASAELAGQLGVGGAGEVVLLSATEPVSKVSHTDARAVASSLGEIVRDALTRSTVAGLLATGGDTASAVLAVLGASGLEVESEIEPLVVAGSIVGGRWDALPVVTKGGLIGDVDTMDNCVAYLTRRAELARLQVPTEADPLRSA